MAAIVFPSSAAGVAPATAAVALREAWGDAWTANTLLECQRLALSTGETLSTATLRYRFAAVANGYLAPGSGTWVPRVVAVVNPLSYVRVVVTGTAGRTGYTWYGVWKSARKDDTVQVFTALGLESLLDEPAVDSPWLDDGSVAWAGRFLEFNARGKPNRSAAKHSVNGTTCYVFDPDPATAQLWTTRDAVETLLACAAPQDPDGTVLWNWTPQNLAALPDYDAIRQACHGTSYLNLLRALVPRTRLVGWTCEPGTGNTVDIRFFTFAETATTLTDKAGTTVGTIPANALADSLNIAADQSSQAASAQEASNVADQVIVTGGRRRSVFSLSVMDDTLWSRWSSLAEYRYGLAARDAADYPPATEVYARELRDAQARGAEQFRHVFALWGPFEDWDQLVGNGIGTIAAESMEPIATEEDGSQFLLYPGGLEFEERLPLLTGYDYESSAIADHVDTVGHKADEIADEDHEPRPVAVFVRTVLARADQDATDRWVSIDRLGLGAGIERPDDATNRNWSADVRAARDQMAIEIRVNGEAQHVLGKVEVASGDPFLPQDVIPGSLDWGADMIFTVSVQEPRCVEVRYPADDDVTTYGELVRQIRVEDPDAQLIYVVPNTVVDVDTETHELQWSEGGYIEDDRPQMLVLAQRIYAWHRVPRVALTWASKWIDGAVQIGHLMTGYTDHVGTYGVLSVVTEIALEFPIAAGPDPAPASCSVQTSFAEMDPRAVGRI
jgi:hypothetical protein